MYPLLDTLLQLTGLPFVFAFKFTLPTLTVAIYLTYCVDNADRRNLATGHIPAECSVALAHRTPWRKQIIRGQEQNDREQYKLTILSSDGQ